MTSPPEEIEVTCPGCGHVYRDWRRASFNLSLPDEFDDEYMDQATSAICPRCGLKVYFETLVTGKEVD
jgi:endogenous inhibitor of DNA gyrase (YacG/DUF329 family)